MRSKFFEGLTVMYGQPLVLIPVFAIFSFLLFLSLPDCSLFLLQN